MSMQLHLGSEIEFFTSDTHLLPNNVINEYYPNQFEVNDFHVINSSLDENLNMLHDWSKQLVANFADGRLDFGGVVRGSGGPVFSGVHLHLQVRGDGRRDQGTETRDKMMFAERLSKVVMADIIRYYGLSFRNLSSHHLHGAYRMSQFTYKQKAKFCPVNYHEQFDTYEIRCIEPDMLYTVEGRAALKSILNRAYRYLCGENVRIASKYSGMAKKLSELSGDMTHAAHIREYKDYAGWLKDEGVNVRFSIREPERRRFKFSFPNTLASDNTIYQRSTSYVVAVESGSTGEQQRRGVTRLRGEHITAFEERVRQAESRRIDAIFNPQLTEIRYTPLGEPIALPSRNFTSAAQRIRYEASFAIAYHKYIEEFPHYENNPNPRGSLEARYWQRENAPYSESNPYARGSLMSDRWEAGDFSDSIVHSSVRKRFPTRDVKVGDVWDYVDSQGRTGFAHIGHNGKFQYTGVMPTALTFSNSFHMPEHTKLVSERYHHNIVEVARRDTPNYDVIEALRARYPDNDIQIGSVMRAVSADGRDGYAVVCHDGGVRWSSTFPSMIPATQGFTNLNRVNGEYWGRVDERSRERGSEWLTMPVAAGIRSRPMDSTFITSATVMAPARNLVEEFRMSLEDILDDE